MVMLVLALDLGLEAPVLGIETQPRFWNKVLGTGLDSGVRWNCTVSS